MTRPAVFLDKDGTIVEDVPYNGDPARVRLANGAAHALRSLADAGLALVLITNQSGLARGVFGREQMEAVLDRLRALLAEQGVGLNGVYVCPHHPRGAVAELAGRCGCRKPEPGLIRRAVEELRLDPARSWMVGDILDDVEAGRRAGCRTILLDVGGETAWRLGPMRVPHRVCPDLGSAARVILASLHSSSPAR